MFVRLIWVLKAHKHTYCFMGSRDKSFDRRTEGAKVFYQRDYFGSRKDADLRRGYVC